MIRLRHLVIPAAALMLAPLAAKAQAMDTGMKMAGGAVATAQSTTREQLMKGVNLTDDQKSKIKSIYDKYSPQMQNLNPANAADKQKWTDLFNKEVGEIKKVLSPDQIKTLQANATSILNGMK